MMFRTGFTRGGRLTKRPASLVASLMLAIAASAPATAESSSRSPSLEVSAPRHVDAGQPITLTLRVRGFADLAAYETQLRFDTTKATFSTVSQRRNDLAALGRDVVPLDAMQDDGVAIGLATCAVADCVRPLAGQQQRSGGRGNVRVARVQLVPKKPGLLEIAFGSTVFVDPDGQRVKVSPTPPVTIQVGSARGARFPAPTPPSPARSKGTASLSGSSAGVRDLTNDGLTTHADVMEAALAWTRARTQGEHCSGRPDVNADGCLDVADVQVLASGASLLTSRQRQQLRTREATAQQIEGSSTTLALTDPAIVVNSKGDQSDVNVGDGVCATPEGTCTLRAGIETADARSGADVISFDIPGSGPHTITLTQRLPTLSDQTGPTQIRGYSQPGAKVNNSPLASNAVIKVAIKGVGPSGFDAFTITSRDNYIEGLSIYRVHDAFRIYGSGASGNTLWGNYIGTGPAGLGGGAGGRYRYSDGVDILQGAANTRIGATSLAARNVISGNADMGISTYNEDTDSTIIVNNIMGLSSDGTKRIPNRAHAIDINGNSAKTVIGGTGDGERNVLSGNDRAGVELSHGPGVADTKVVGNYIGTDLSGVKVTSYSANGHYGIQLQDRVFNNDIVSNVVGGSGYGGVLLSGSTKSNRFRNNRIGISVNGSPIPNYGNGAFNITNRASSTVIGPGNVLAHNSGTGVRVGGEDSDFNTITRNSIYANTRLGIDLAPLGSVNPNDAGDTDTGPNEQLNYPVIADATILRVSGSACSACTVEVFQADGGGSAHGEGKTFIGSAVADASGSFVAVVTGVTAGDYVTATATDATGNTSEFARNRVVK